jgi:hypothetical protein
MDWTSKKRKVFVIGNIRILFFEVLSNELYYSFTFIGLYYYHINFWVTTSWYLVFLGSSKEFTFLIFCLFGFLDKDVSIFSWTNKTTGYINALLVYDVYCGSD